LRRAAALLRGKRRLHRGGTPAGLACGKRQQGCTQSKMPPQSIFLALACMLIHGAVAARDGLIFKDVAPISVKFEFFNYSPPVPYISFLNTGDEIVHDITISNVINGKKVSVIMTDTIHPHKSVFITNEKLINELRKLGPEERWIRGFG
jgi:hypothetical protein